jgi:hypothetical protein
VFLIIMNIVRASAAEIAFVAAAGGFHDAEGDVVRFVIQCSM